MSFRKVKTDACQLFCGLDIRQPLQQTPAYSVRSQLHGGPIPGYNVLQDMVQLLETNLWLDYDDMGDYQHVHTHPLA
jgi:hypothetical protein